MEHNPAQTGIWAMVAVAKLQGRIVAVEACLLCLMPQVVPQVRENRRQFESNNI